MKKVTPETAIKKEVKDYLKLRGWFEFPITQGLGSYPGISDIIAVRNGVVLFIEVKTETGKQSGAQKEFELLCKDRGIPYILARSLEDVMNNPLL